MNSLNSASTLETHLETQTVIYPTLQYLVRFLPWDGKRVFDHLREECKHNPFIVENSDFHNSEVLLDDIKPNWYNPIAQELSLSEHLLGQISALSIPSRQRKTLTYLTQWLLNSGYLEETPEVWADGSIWSAKELEAVVPILQSLDPPGIGTRSLQECLLIQLKNQPESLAFLLVKNYLEEIANCIGNTSESKQNCQVLLQKVEPFSLNVEPLNLNVAPLSLEVAALNLNVEPFSLNVEPFSLNVEPLNLNIAPLSLEVAPLSLNLAALSLKF
ncbi:MAG: hypothetical protein HWQ44_26230 [Nostoc sp. JL34]|uniref:RNA polymerase factor sigma-54 n=1 Tax=Nostoc sp. JL34 TaxID=2815397 RepID=UPI001D6F2A0D|nr:hypothetical protein [Nostoc sp. JL34]MBN3886322.1 hypothetical protein [Nostoc sp. JL34]